MVDTFGGEFGRRWADHEYPGRDLPYAEDLGRRQRVWRFTGYLIGDTYPFERDRLVAACEMAGAGELIHPTIGAVTVVCRTVSFSEERERGRWCGFELEFAEAGELQEPSAATDRNLACEFAADDLGAVAPQVFGATYDVAGGGSWLAASAAADVEDLSVTLSRLRLPAPGDAPQGPLDLALANLSDNATSLVRSPDILAPAIDSTFAAFTDAGEAEPVVGVMLTFAGDDTTAGWQPGADLQPAGSTQLAAQPYMWRYRGLAPAPVRRANNREALQRFANHLALREVGYAVTGLTLDNYDAATLMLGKIARSFIAVEEAAAAAGDDQIFEALASLRAAITRMISTRAADLNPLVTYRALAPANALTLAWRLYQSSDRDLEIVRRTGLTAAGARNPAFLPMTGRVLSAQPGPMTPRGRGR